MENTIVDLNQYLDATCRTTRRVMKSGITIIEMIFNFVDGGRFPTYPSKLEMLCDSCTELGYDPDFLIRYKEKLYKIKQILRIEDFIMPTRATIKILAWDVTNELERDVDGK